LREAYRPAGRERPAGQTGALCYVREKPSSSRAAQSSVFSMGSPWRCRTIIFGMIAWVQIWAATRGGAGEQEIVLF
jgi:hypothetical protein